MDGQTMGADICGNKSVKLLRMRSVDAITDSDVLSTVVQEAVRMYAALEEGCRYEPR
jgi:hypothetical protein